MNMEDFANKIKSVLKSSYVMHEVAHGEVTVVVRAEKVVDALTALRDHKDLRLVQLIDLCGVDWPGRSRRFDVVYHLLSPFKNTRLRVKAMVGEGESIASVCDVFPVANWFEREAFDMYGINFSGHPDLRRLLTDYGFEGHPFRKDFPLTGYVEVRYDETKKRVVYEPVKLTQEYRHFDTLSPWEGAEYTLPGDEKAGVDQ